MNQTMGTIDPGKIFRFTAQQYNQIQMPRAMISNSVVSKIITFTEHIINFTTQEATRNNSPPPTASIICSNPPQHLLIFWRYLRSKIETTGKKTYHQFKNRKTQCKRLVLHKAHIKITVKMSILEQ